MWNLLLIICKMNAMANGLINSRGLRKSFLQTQPPAIQY